MAGKSNPLVQKALALLKADPRMTTYEAIKITGANAQSVYSAVRRMRFREGDDRPLCPCCGVPVERGVEVKLPTAEPVATDAENVTLSTAVRVIRDVIQERGPIARQALAIELDALLKMARGS